MLLKRWKKFVILGSIIFPFIVLSVGYAQTGEIAYPAFPPAALWIALILGFVVHWGVNYSRGKIEDNFLKYLLTNLGQTFGAIIASIGQFIGFWGSSPQNFYPVTILACWTVFLMSYASDSALNGTGPFIKKSE